MQLCFVNCFIWAILTIIIIFKFIEAIYCFSVDFSSSEGWRFSEHVFTQGFGECCCCCCQTCVLEEKLTYAGRTCLLLSPHIWYRLSSAQRFAVFYYNTSCLYIFVIWACDLSVSYAFPLNPFLYDIQCSYWSALHTVWCVYWNDFCLEKMVKEEISLEKMIRYPSN